jgi:heterodisulfide reductase subunit A
VDVPSVVEYVRKLPHVVFADENLYTCSQDSLEIIKAEVEKHNLTRVVVASCNPLTHGPLFRETIREVGLNPYLFELASIREHVSWVHMNEPKKATQKAKEIVAMAVSKAALLKPIEQEFFEMNKEGLILGGGISGMTAALSLAEQGFVVHHGIIVIATGGKENQTSEYLYGKNPAVITQTDLEEKLAQDKDMNPKRVVMIQCVGSRDTEHPYCSRVCCSHAIKNAIQLKKRNPDTEVVILYRDIRTYGFREKYYLEARQKGVLFIRYDEEHKPQVTEKESQLHVEQFDPVINKNVSFDPDLLVLSTGIVADNDALSQLLLLPLDEDGFFMEAHAKIRPLDFMADGLFLCGLAHSPRTVEESIAQAQGVSIRAVTILSKDKIQAKAEIPTVNEKWCSACGLCEAACPYGARKINEDTHIADVIEVLCQGCGACTVACPSGVTQQKGFEKEEIFTMIEHAF